MCCDSVHHALVAQRQSGCFPNIRSRFQNSPSADFRVMFSSGICKILAKIDERLQKVQLLHFPPIYPLIDHQLDQCFDKAQNMGQHHVGGPIYPVMYHSGDGHSKRLWEDANASPDALRSRCKYTTGFEESGSQGAIP